MSPWLSTATFQFPYCRGAIRKLSLILVLWWSLLTRLSATRVKKSPRGQECREEDHTSTRAGWAVQCRGCRGICPVGSWGGGACAPTPSLHTSCTNSYTSRALPSADEQFSHRSRCMCWVILKVASLSQRRKRGSTKQNSTPKCVIGQIKHCPVLPIYFIFGCMYFISTYLIIQLWLTNGILKNPIKPVSLPNFIDFCNFIGNFKYRGWSESV